MEKYLHIEGLEYKIESLEEGDFTNEVDSFIIERKRGFDLVNSLLKKKIYAQLVRMIEKHPDALRYVLFEGDFQALVDMQSNASIRALLISFKFTVCHVYGAQWIECYDKFQTCRTIRAIDKYSRTVKDKPMWEPLHVKGNWDQRLRVIMSMTPRIGQMVAEDVLDRFKTVEDYYESCKNDRKKVLGLKGYGKTKLENTLRMMQSPEPFIRKIDIKKSERTDEQNIQADKKRKAYHAKKNAIYKKKSNYSGVF